MVQTKINYHAIYLHLGTRKDAKLYSVLIYMTWFYKILFKNL